MKLLVGTRKGLFHMERLNSGWEISEPYFLGVPCLNAFSVRNSLRLRDIRFVGGASELGNYIEFYELFGPDLLRFYTGVQAKKGNVVSRGKRVGPGARRATSPSSAAVASR